MKKEYGLKLLIFPHIRPVLSVVQDRLRYHFKTCTLDNVEFVVKLALQSSPNLALFWVISQQ